MRPEPVDIVFCAAGENPAPWHEALVREAGRAGLGPLGFHLWPDVDGALDARFAFIWGPPADLFERLDRLEVAFSLGAGVDHLLKADGLPPDLPIVRMVDSNLTSGMAEYVLFHVLRFARRFDEYERLRAARRWEELPQRPAASVRVGIMGAGVLGAAAAKLLLGVGYEVAMWSRSGRGVPVGARAFTGSADWHGFLARSEIVVCLLPLNDATRGIVNADMLERLPPGAFVINCGRGGHVVEADLLAALDSGRVAGAALDVFATEPLPNDSPFWGHDRVWLTPHVASLTSADTGAAHVVDGIRRHLAGEPLVHVVDRDAGY